MSWEESPIVSFTRGGESLTLGRGPEDPVLHLYGSKGLGLAPVSIESSPRLTGDGSIVRGVRYDSREIFIPLLLDAGSLGELTEMRRSLYRMLAPHLGMVEIRVQDPVSGTDRYIKGYLKDGLEGDFGDGFHGYWQTLGLTFECPDPWWMGPDHLIEMQVAPGVKPFISDTVPFFPVMLAGSTIQGKFPVEIQGDAPVRPVWSVTGPGTDLVIASGGQYLEVGGTFQPGTTYTFDGRTGRMDPDRLSTTSLRSTIFPLQPGTQTVTATLTGASPDTMIRLTYRERWMEAI